MTRSQFLALLPLFKCQEMIVEHNINIARKVGTSVDKKEAWCYFINGQSNAFGNSPNGNLTSPLNVVIPNCYIYHKPNATTDTNTQFEVDNGSWQPLSVAANQLTDYLGTFYGPELKMGYDLQAYYQRDIFIFKFAIGDTALSSESASGTPGAGGLLDWAPGSDNELYERSVDDYWIRGRDKLLSYGRLPIAKGGLWMQGERDAFFSGFASTYEANLIALFAAWRSAYAAPSMHFAVGRISNEVGDDRPFGNTVRAAQTNVGALTNNSLIDTDAYVNQVDDVHFADHSVLGADAAAKFIAANP